MSEQKFPRRTLLKGALLGVAAVPVSALLSRTATAAGGRVDPNEPQAKSLGYVEDATKVDAKANPNFKPGQMCAGCLQAPTAKPGMAEVPCNIFAGRPVAAKGWCKVFVKRP
jgi:High potential iron-sulfur protein